MTKEIKIQDLQLQDLTHREIRSVRVSVRTTEKVSQWMAKKKIKPSTLFNKCAKVLMEQNE